MLTAHLIAERPGFRLDVRLRAARGEVVALLGPDGAGKTTALRVLAGLDPAPAGHVLLDGEPVHTRPAETRSVGLLGADPLLFPHLSVLDNVAFGPRCQGTGRPEARRAAAAWLLCVGLAGSGAGPTRALTAEQARRVALARALAARPRLLLLDEPLAGLPSRPRRRLRELLRHQLRGFGGICLLATRDAYDAAALADRLVVLEDGAVTRETGPAPARTPGPVDLRKSLSPYRAAEACLGSVWAEVKGWDRDGTSPRPASSRSDHHRREPSPMARQIPGYQPPSPIELEARLHNLEQQVADLTEAVRSLTLRAGETAATGSGD
ncbi:hypothetical protein Sru01_38060 [Sphaerisporangium rufum]|uniref:ABC transporter domain-containing protein n=1 Tax=Sphaerisporangium rufum TaxID=1381558 RepID=A0A919V0J2_9ACTN|nr:ATP-binding cassette domain-containing protein [Sphaerisporangium rufum]GII78824.1 hypothetical protein Sru01_38060 [Sphaerisporangium rufum]